MDAAQSGDDLVATMIKEKRHANRPTILFEDDNGNFQTAEFSTIDARAGQIALLKLSGAMFQDDFISTKGMRSFADDIRQADQNPNIAAILIEANTGGGELLAGQTLRNAIKDTGKPVLVYAHYLGSAGVWGTIFADHIMAAGKGSEIGSIGVFTSLNKGFLEAYKEQMVSIYSRKSQKKNQEFRALLAGDYTPLENALTEADEIFMADVKHNRPLAGDVDDTLSGAMFFAADARSRGLVDSIGTFQDAIAETQRLIRKNKTQLTMKKISLAALAKKYLGLDFTSEEEAAAALEADQGSDTALNTRVEEMAQSMAALQAEVADLRTQAETLRDAIANLTQAIPQIPTGIAMESTVTEQLESFRQEVAVQINEIRTMRSGAAVEGDGAINLPAGGNNADEKIGIDLLEAAKKANLKTPIGLQ